MLLWIILFGPTQAEELLISYFPLFQSFLTLLGETTRPTEWQPLWKTKYFCVICKAQLPFNNFTRQTRTPSSVCMLRNHITKIIKNSYRDIRLRSSASQPIVNCLCYFLMLFISSLSFQSVATTIKYICYFIHITTSSFTK